MKKLNEVKEAMFERKLISYGFEKKATTPSRSELQMQIAKLEKTKPELVVVENVSVKYGTNEFTVKVSVYDNAESYKKFVPKHLVKTSEIKVEAPAEEAKTT